MTLDNENQYYKIYGQRVSGPVPAIKMSYSKDFEEAHDIALEMQRDGYVTTVSIEICDEEPTKEEHAQSISILQANITKMKESLAPFSRPPDNVVSFDSAKKQRQNPDNEKSVEDIYKEAVRRNKEHKEKMAKERIENNKKVLRNYNVTPKGPKK
jgi:hypothetical protein